MIPQCQSEPVEDLKKKALRQAQCDKLHSSTLKGLKLIKFNKIKMALSWNEIKDKALVFS